MITVSIIGVGARGGFVYGKYMNTLKDKFKIVALCDKNMDKINKYAPEFGVEAENCFTDEKEFFEKKRSDLLVIATLDDQHVRHGLLALKLGYNILMEKPISASEKECDELLKASKESKGKILVCHVLRYTAMIRKMKELLDSGAIGKLIYIDHTEQVEYWHMSHSYVRGNWRREEDTSPILLAKCCHDLDLIQYFAGSPCKTVASQGSLAWFKKENAPEGASKRCLDCKYVDSCPYSAKNIYYKRFVEQNHPQLWPYNVLTDKFITEEELLKCLKEGPYGRCVYYCDNDVYDNQHVEMTFENGVKAVLKMLAFTHTWGRHITLYGSLGEIILTQEEDTIQLALFNQPVKTFKISELVDNSKDNFGHGGGDVVMMNELYDMLSNDTCGCGETSLEKSIESHKIAFAADRSAQEFGTLQYIKR